MTLDATTIQALEILAEQGNFLGGTVHAPWPKTTKQAVHRLLLDARNAHLPSFVAVVGGASSGKSTVFNNLLEGNLASRITAKGHSTVGPILAVHEDDRETVETWLDRHWLLPDRAPHFTELDQNVTGGPGKLTIVFHRVAGLSGKLLFDTPDFTSDASRREGDLTMALLPWFDRLLVVIDHERWFDRQSISDLRRESHRFGQDRLVLFNRTREGELKDSDASALQKQAERLDAADLSILEFRRGRGFCRFAPGTLDKALTFVQGEAPRRTESLHRHISRAAADVLNQNEERRARLKELDDVLNETVRRALPTSRDCISALMMPNEKRLLEVAGRVLRLAETTAWIHAQRERFRKALGSVPIVGSVMRSGTGNSGADPIDPPDRIALATRYYQSVVSKLSHEMQWALASSSFWDEMRRWTGLEPDSPEFAWSERSEKEVRERAARYDHAIQAWNTRVESECQGIAPHVKGAVGFGAVALGVVLIAVPGPVSALTLVSVKGALGAAIGKLLAATGVGAAAGRHATRLTAVIREKLIGSEEFNAVQLAADAFHGLLSEQAATWTGNSLAEASRFVMRDDDPIVTALQTIRSRES